MSNDGSTTDTSKRDFIKKATYVVPAVLTLTAAPKFAAAGSGSGKQKAPKTVKLKKNGKK